MKYQVVLGRGSIRHLEPLQLCTQVSNFLEISVARVTELNFESSRRTQHCPVILHMPGCFICLWTRVACTAPLRSQKAQYPRIQHRGARNHNKRGKQHRDYARPHRHRHEDQVSDTIAPVQPLDVGADASVLVLTTSFVVPMSIYVEARW